MWEQPPDCVLSSPCIKQNPDSILNYEAYCYPPPVLQPQEFGVILLGILLPTRGSDPDRSSHPTPSEGSTPRRAPLKDARNYSTAHRPTGPQLRKY